MIKTYSVHKINLLQVRSSQTITLLIAGLSDFNEHCTNK